MKDDHFIIGFINDEVVFFYFLPYLTRECGKIRTNIRF